MHFQPISAIRPRLQALQYWTLKMPPVIGESFKGDQSQNLAFKKINLEGIDLAIQQSFYGNQSRRLLLKSDLSLNTVCTNFSNEGSEL